MQNRRTLASAFGLLLSAFLVLVTAVPSWAESAGQADFDEAMRLRVTAEGLPDLNNVIERLQQSLDKGLEVEDAETAEGMLSGALMERATTLMQVVNSNSIGDDRIQQILKLVISDLRRVLAYDNPPPEANFMLGKLLSLPGGDQHEARRVLTAFLKTEDLQPEERAEAYMLRARVQSDESKALEDFDEAIKLVPDNANYGLIRAMYLRSKEKYDEALAAVDKMIGQSPEDANALILQGEIFREMDKPDDALKSFDEAIKLAPQSPAPYQARGEIYREKEDYDKAIQEFTKVVELQPGDVLPLVHRAEAYLNAGKLKEALADADAVLEKQQIVAAHRLRGEILAQLNRLNDAIAEMQQLTKAVPNQPELKIQLALYYLINKQPNEAISEYDDILLLDPENFLALRNRADAYLNVGKHKEAIEDFDKALKLEPEDTSILNNLAWVLATSPEANLRDGKRAVELATKACELTDYKMPHMLSTLAAAFAESGNFDTAMEWSQKAVDLNDPKTDPNDDQEAQLVKELESYRKKEPWRERQDVGETKGKSGHDASPPSRDDDVQRSLDF
jgi:tetratricopeptide (TPR) repeat protein